MTKRTISMTLEGAINALAKNKDGNQVAAAGRNGEFDNILFIYLFC